MGSNNTNTELSANSAPDASIGDASLQPTTPAPDVASPKKNKTKLWVIICIIIAVICGLAIAGWYFLSQSQKVAPTNKAKATSAANKLIIGTDATYEPMEYLSPQGKIVGYDIDLGKAIAAELGVEIEYKNIPWDDVFKALEDKKIDMIISSVSITDERKQKYDFSEGYLNAGQVILTRKETTDITSTDSLQGKKVAVQQDTVSETEAIKYTRLVLRFPDFEQATTALVDGRADAMMSDLLGAKSITKANPTLKIATDPFTNDYSGVVFRKNDPNVTKINEALSALRTKGVLTDLKQKWLD